MIEHQRDLLEPRPRRPLEGPERMARAELHGAVDVVAGRDAIAEGAVCLVHDREDHPLGDRVGTEIGRARSCPRGSIEAAGRPDWPALLIAIEALARLPAQPPRADELLL